MDDLIRKLPSAGVRKDAIVVKCTFDDEEIQRVVTEIKAAIPLQWIPCKERLPEAHVDVLICDNYGNITDGELIDTSHFGWLGAMSDRSYDFDDVVAWMPLPEPYREEDNAE